MASNSVLKWPKIQGHILKFRLCLGAAHLSILNINGSVSPIVSPG